MDRPRETEHFQLDPAELGERETYLLATGCVVPRPIGWISTLAPDGTMNVAPHSFFNIVASDPVMLMFCSLGRKDSIRNVEHTGDFVANIVSEELAEPMNLTSADCPPDVSEFDVAKLTAACSRSVKSPRVAEAAISIECKLEQIVELGRRPSYVAIGEVIQFHIHPRIWRNGRVDPTLLRPLGRLAGSWYSYTREFFTLTRPTWEGLGKGELPVRNG